MMGFMTEDEKLRAQELTDFDNAVIRDLKGADTLTRDAVLERVMLLPDAPTENTALSKTVTGLRRKWKFSIINILSGGNFSLRLVRVV